VGRLPGVTAPEGAAPSTRVGSGAVLEQLVPLELSRRAQDTQHQTGLVHSVWALPVTLLRNERLPWSCSVLAASVVLLDW